MLEGFKKSARDDAAETKDHHFSNLHDQDEDRAGQKVDEATGKKINNSRAVTGADEKLYVVEADRDAKSEDVLGTLPDDDDAAARWLREHDKGGDLKEAA
jgi:hypothetical protein